MTTKRLIVTAFTTIFYIATATAQGSGSGINKDNMDTTIDPGDDFYNYASGKWINNLPARPEYSRYGQFNILEEQNQERIKNIIIECSKKNAAHGTIEQKIGDLYTLYMDTLKIDSDGSNPLKPYLEMVDTASTKNSLMEVVFYLKRRNLGSMFFNIYVGADLKNVGQNITSLYQGGIVLGLKDYYIDNDSATVAIRNAYKSYMTKILTLAGNSQKMAAIKAEIIYNIEKQLAQKHFSNLELRNLEANYHEIQYSQLSEMYPQIDWDKMFKILGFPKLRNLCIDQPEAIRNACQIIENESLDNLKAYVEYMIICSSTSYLSSDFTKADFELMKVMEGVSQDKPRWKKAVGEVNNSFGMAVGKLYVEKYFSEDSKKAVLSMVKNIQEALKQRINESTWMSDSTKLNAIDKLENFYVKIGYPDNWRDYSSIDIDTSKSLLDNALNVSKFDFDYMVKTRCNKPTNRDEWYMTPQTVNAYYSPNVNGITFPAAILQPPFFDPNADEAANYGGIGCVIGHEMTHGFDDQGSQFDKNGKYVNWWTDKDREEFNKRAAVLADFFDKQQPLPGEFANGKMTLGENIADHGGIRISFLALQNLLKTKDLGIKDGFTPQQRFYINYGFIWAGRITDEALRKRLKTDYHSPAKLRVNCQLPHQQSWYDAFGIDKNSKLYIKESKRVDIW